MAKLGDVALVEITFLVSPFDQDASILRSSPAPVGMFLICKAAITEPPHFVSGCPLISEREIGAAETSPVAPAGAVAPKKPPTPLKLPFRMLYEALTS